MVSQKIIDDALAVFRNTVGGGACVAVTVIGDNVNTTSQNCGLGERIGLLEIGVHFIKGSLITKPVAEQNQKKGAN